SLWLLALLVVSLLDNHLLLSAMGRRSMRGLTRGIEVSRTIAMNNGNKLPVVFSEIEKAPTCFNAPKLSSKCRIIVRGLAPLQHKSWTKIPEHHRSALTERIKVC
ncbi:hypothetical protein MKX01_039115, partial [Papaver californicum]